MIFFKFVFLKYWHKHPDKFFEKFYGMKLYWYQKLMLKMIMKKNKKYIVMPKHHGISRGNRSKMKIYEDSL